MKKLLALALFASSALDCSASPSAYEGFDCTDPSALNGAAGGTGFSGGWVTTTNAGVSTPLSFTNPEVTGNGASLSGPDSSDLDYRSFTNRGWTDTWISFLHQRTSTLVNGFTGLTLGQGNASIAGGFFSGTNGLFIGQWGPLANILMGLNDVDGIGLSLGGGVTAGIPYSVVIELDCSGPTSGTMRGYLNPAPGNLSPGAANASTDFTLQDLDRIGLESSISDGLRVDEIRIGDSYIDVSPVPEPSTIAFLGAAAAVLVMTRLRRKA